MPVPSPRNKILPARGLYADLLANIDSLLDGEICYALDGDQYYQKEGGVLVAVGASKAQGLLADSALQPGGNVSELSNDAGYITANDVPEVPVTSVASKTGDVTLVKADITDLNEADYATAAQGLLADTSSQPGDNVSTFSNDVGYITDYTVTSEDVVAHENDLTIAQSQVTNLTTDLASKADLVGGVIPTSQIPAIAITEFLGSVADESEMLALTGQQGDWCLRTDKAVGYVIIGADPSQSSNWESFTVPGSAVTTVNNQVGDIVLGFSDVGAASAAQGALADTSVQPNDNVSDLVNDAGYLTGTDGNGFVNVAGDNMTGDLTLGTDKITLNATTGSAAFESSVNGSAFYSLEPTGTPALAKLNWFHFYLKDDAGDTTAEIKNDGSAEFAGNVSTTARFSADRANPGDGCYRGNLNGATTSIIYADGRFTLGGTPNAPTVDIKADGSASFASEVSIGGLLTVDRASGGAIEVKQSGTSVFYLDTSGLIGIGGLASTPGQANINLKGSDGSATFAGVGTFSGDLRVQDGGNFRVRTAVDSATDAILLQNNGNITASGSATFAGRITVDTSPDPLNSHAYVGITSHPDRAVYRATNINGGKVFSGHTDSTETSSITASGNASFASTITAGGYSMANLAQL